MSRRVGICLLLGSVAVASCASFEQTKARGSLIDYEMPVVPEPYQGVWASPKDACFVTRDYGVQMRIDEQMVGNEVVAGVRGYSDYPDVVLDLVSQEGDSGLQESLWLQLSLNGNKLRARRDGENAPTLFHRCKLN